MNNQVNILPQFCFGLKTEVKENVWFQDENIIVYVAGDNVVVYDLIRKTQKFITGGNYSNASSGVETINESLDGITAIALSPNRRYVAVAERGTTRAWVSIFDIQSTKKKKVLSTLQCASKYFVSIQFSPDSKFLITQGGDPDWSCFYWAWDKNPNANNGNPNPNAQNPNPATSQTTEGATASHTIPNSQSSGNLSQHIESIKPLAPPIRPSPPTQIFQASFHPNDNTIFCITGKAVMRVYRLIDNNMKLLPGSSSSALTLSKRSDLASATGIQGSNFVGQQYLCHAWIAGLISTEERLIVGTDTGELLLFESTGEYKTSLAQSPNDGLPIKCVVGYSKGFVCGGESGRLLVYEKTDDKDYYRKSRSIDLGSLITNLTSKLYTPQSVLSNQVSIHSIAVSSSEEWLCVTTENNQIFRMKFPSSLDHAEAEANAASHSHHTKREKEKLDLEREIDLERDSNLKFEYLNNSFHSNQVTGLDVCIRRPLIATSSIDKSVRLWNHKNNTLEIMKTFPEDVFSVALHPSGLQVLIGFSDKLRLMNVVNKDLFKVSEFDIRSCRECRFSNGGQFFAAVNGAHIHIFNTYTFESVSNLRGHNGKVRSVYWTPDDSRLITCGMDGAIYDWQVKDMKRVCENVQKTCLYSSAVCSDDAKTIFAVGADKKLKEINTADSEVVNSVMSSVTLTQLAISHSGQFLFAGTDKGSIRIFKFPLTGDFTEVMCHSGAVSRIRISVDDSMLFSAGDDGSIFMIDTKSRDSKRKLNEIYTDIDQILITKADLEEKDDALANWKNKYDELLMHNEYQLKLKDMNQEEKLKDQKDSYHHQIEQWKSKYEALQQEKADSDSVLSARIAELNEKHYKEKHEIENKYQQQIVDEVERYQLLLKSKDELRAQYQVNLTNLGAQHEKQVLELRETYETKNKEGLFRLESGKKEVKQIIEEFEETRVQIEEDADKEIELMKHEYEEKFAAERQTTLKLRGENNLLNNKFGILTSEIDDLKAQIIDLNIEKKTLQHQIHNLEKDGTGLRKEIRDRDDTLADKEKRIFDLKKKNQDLEKFKFVLDYTIKELKKQAEPLTSEIADLKDQIKEMDEELERYNKNGSNLELNIRDLKLKNDAIIKEMNTQKKRAVKAESESRRIRTDLHEAMQFIQEPNVLKERIKEIYKKHVDVKVEEVALDTDIQREYQRQREYLERSVGSLKKQLNKESEKHRTDNNKIMQENVALITEINSLRRELKLLKQSQKDKELVFITRRQVNSSPESSSVGGSNNNSNNNNTNKLKINTLHGNTKEKEISRQPSPVKSRTPQSGISKVASLGNIGEEVKIIEMQREELKRMKKKVAELEASAMMAKARPTSSGGNIRLPAIGDNQYDD